MSTAQVGVGHRPLAEQPSRREFFERLGVLALLSGGLVIVKSEGRSAAATLKIEDATIATLLGALNSGAITSRELCERYLARIRTSNPLLHALIETNPDALKIADQRDEERRTGRVRGSLHGIPIVLKDNLETADQMQTTSGSRVLEGVPVGRDAFVVAQLRLAGAILLGKANLTEWAGPGLQAGWSSRGGQTVNPYGRDRTPLGSSSGSAAAVAASFAAASIGSETVGSIVGPAAVMGLVGLRPTTGLVSRTGTVTFNPSMDTIGPITRTVEDAAILLDVMSAPDPSDPALGRPAAVHAVRAIGAKSLAGTRLGVVRESELAPSVQALFDRAVADLQKLGAAVVEVTLPPIDETVGKAFAEVLFSELKDRLPRYLIARKAPVQSLDALMAFNARHATHEHPAEWLGQAGFQLAKDANGMESPEYREALKTIRSTTGTHGIDAAVDQHRLDALVGYAIGPAWTAGNEAPPSAGIFLSSMAGYPSLTVPMGNVDGLPAGVLFFGKAWTEPALLRCAHAYEQATHHHRPPPSLG